MKELFEYQLVSKKKTYATYRGKLKNNLKSQNIDNNLVPFGKYKGQPLDVLQNDRQYLEWITSQDWFRDKYANISNILLIRSYDGKGATLDQVKKIFAASSIEIIQLHEIVL